MDTIISTALNILQFRDRAALYAVCRNTETLVNVLLSIAFVVCFRLALDGRVYAILISKIMFAVVGVVVIIRFVGFSPQVDITQIKDELFNFGIPMIPTVLKGTILTYLDRIFITNMNSVSETGLYTTGNQLSLPILFLAQAFNMAYLPWLYKKLQEDEPRTKRKIVIMTYIYFGVIAVVAFLWTIFATFVAKYVLGGEYAESTTYIGLLSLGYAFSGMHMMVVGYIYYEKRTKLYNIVTITVIFSNVILNYIFIGNNGSVGAAQATLIVNIISFVLTWIMAAKIHKMPWKLWKKIPSKM
jgi:O-antigen/teichoic acid export membrane protein